MTKPVYLTRRWHAVSRTAGILSGLSAIAAVMTHTPILARLAWAAALTLGLVWIACFVRANHIDGQHLTTEEASGE